MRKVRKARATAKVRKARVMTAARVIGAGLLAALWAATLRALSSATMVTGGPAPAAGATLPDYQDEVDYHSAAGFVWSDRRHGGWDIFRKRWDGAGWVDEWVCRASGDQTHPQAAERFVVWQDHRGSDWNIYGYSIADAAEFVICGADGDQTHPRIDGDHVVWQDHRGSDWNVWEATLGDPAGPPAGGPAQIAGLVAGPTQVTRGSADDTAPDVSGDHIVFETGTGNDLDIYGASFGDPAAPPRAICGNGKRQDQPVVDGDTVVWRDFRDLGANGTDLYGHSYARDANFPVATAAGDQESPSVSGDIVVFSDYRQAFLSDSVTQGPDIVFCDPTRLQEGSVCVAGGAQNKPVICGLTVAWTDWRDANSKSDIWTAELNPWTVWLSLAGGNHRWVNDPLIDLELGATSKYGAVTQMTVTNVGTSGPVAARPFATELTGWDLDAVLADTSDGSRTVRVWFTDDSGGCFADSPPAEVMVTLDTEAPTARAPYAARVRSGATLTLRYRVDDALAPKARATIAITTPTGTPVKTLLGWAPTGKLVGRTFVCRLAPGVYRFSVTARDVAGNVGAASARQTLTVTR